LNEQNVPFRAGEVVFDLGRGERFEVLSVGKAPTEVHPLTRQVLADLGLEPSGIHAKRVDLCLAKVSIAYAIIVWDRAEADCLRLYPFALLTLYGPFDDPTQVEGSTAERLYAFRTIRDQIQRRVQLWLEELELRAYE
jgi:arsenate reductase (thioredoxin)